MALGACAGGPAPAAPDAEPRTGELRHPGGTLAQQGPLVDGAQQGEWTFWDAGGHRIAVGSYDRDVRTGTWTHWYANGNLRMRGEYHGERQVGTWEFWHENGTLMCRGDYVDGREDGEWVFWHDNGRERQRGLFAAGKRRLRWTEHDAGGSLVALGSYLGDVPVGRWQRRAADGVMQQLDYPLPEGAEQVLETWDDGSLRREGFTRNGLRFGVWASHHRGGALRATVEFIRYGPIGRFTAHDADGALIATGNLADGTVQGSWRVRGANGLTAVQLPLEPAAPFDRTWSDAAIAATADPADVARRWLAELCSPPDVQPTPAAPTTPAPTPPHDPIGQRLEAPTDPGTFTVREREELAMLRRYYDDGWLPRGQTLGARYGGTPGDARLGNGNPTLAEAAVGKPLPVARFPTPGGEPLDLGALRGKRVLFVMLRGFTSGVCVYCCAQTGDLAPHALDFAQLDCEVVVMYPGSRSQLEAFTAACKAEFGDAPAPYRLVYDQDLALAQALGLVGNLARPAAFALDRDGIVRSAYVAESIENTADRPCVRDLMRWISRLP